MFFSNLFKSLSYRFFLFSLYIYQTDARFQLHWISFCDMRFLMEFLLFLFLSKGIQDDWHWCCSRSGCHCVCNLVSRFIFHWLHRLYGNDWFDFWINECGMWRYAFTSNSYIYIVCVFHILVNIEYVIFSWHSIDFIVCALCLFGAIYILHSTYIDGYISIFFHSLHPMFPYHIMIYIRTCGSVFCLINEFTISMKV